MGKILGAYEKHIGDPNGIRARIVDYIKQNGATRAEDLFKALSKDDPWLTRRKLAEIIRELHDSGSVGLEDTPPASGSFAQYLRLWERNPGLYGAFILALAAILAIYVLPTELPLVIVRSVLGLVFILLVPGYVTTKAFFPGKELNLVEVLALSIGLSLGFMVFVGFLLNYTSWGIRLTQIVISLTILTVIVGMLGFGREYASARSRPS